MLSFQPLKNKNKNNTKNKKPTADGENQQGRQIQGERNRAAVFAAEVYVQTLLELKAKRADSRWLVSKHHKKCGELSRIKKV